jgi:broad specificity phosphatase PhoE
MRLILIRHAATDGNTNRFVGREDLPLNDAGRQQAVELATMLSDETIHAVWSSPLARAVSTALPIAGERGLAIDVRPELVEIDYGTLQGTVKGSRPFRLRKEFADRPMPGGESLRDVWRRLEAATCDLRRTIIGGRVPAVVGHYWSNRLLLAQLSGIPFETALDGGHYKPVNASAYALDFDMSGGALRMERTSQLGRPSI